MTDFKYWVTDDSNNSYDSIVNYSKEDKYVDENMQPCGIEQASMKLYWPDGRKTPIFLPLEIEEKDGEREYLDMYFNPVGEDLAVLVRVWPYDGSGGYITAVNNNKNA
jgi:hypothetical protein